MNFSDDNKSSVWLKDSEVRVGYCRLIRHKSPRSAPREEHLPPLSEHNLQNRIILPLRAAVQKLFEVPASAQAIDRGRSAPARARQGRAAIPWSCCPAGPRRLPLPCPTERSGRRGTVGPLGQPASLAGLTCHTGPRNSYRSPGLRADDLGKVQLLENDMPSKNSASPHLYPACRRDLHWPCKPGYSVEALEEFKGRIHLPSSEEARRHMEQLGDTEPSERMAQRLPPTLTSCSSITAPRFQCNAAPAI